MISKNSLASPSAEWKALDLSDPVIYKLLKKSLKRLQRERMKEKRPYKERLKNLLNNVHSVRIHNSQDNSCIFIERITEVDGGETDGSSINLSRQSPRNSGLRSGEDAAGERGLGIEGKQRSINSVGDGEDHNNEKYSLMIPKFQKKIIQKLEKILEERQQSGDSSDHSPYRMKLTALDNS
jgi:hypothetical protein